MKPILLVLIVAFPFLAFAGSYTPEELARNYVAAVQTRDPAAIKKLVHPKLLESLKGGDQKLLSIWILNGIGEFPNLKNPVQIRPGNINSAHLASLVSQGNWNVPPELQIKIRSYTGGTTELFAARYQGQCYFVFELPKTL